MPTVTDYAISASIPCAAVGGGVIDVCINTPGNRVHGNVTSFITPAQQAQQGLRL